HCEAEAACDEKRDDSAPLFLAVQHLHREQRLLVGCYAPVGPSEERLTEQDSEKNEQRRRRQSQQRERRRALRNEQPPFLEVVEPKKKARVRGRQDDAPKKITPKPAWARDPPQEKTKNHEEARQQNDQPVRVAPAQGRGEEAGDDKGDRAGDRGDARQ